MSQVKGKDYELLGGRVPKKLADRVKKHADQLRMKYTDVYVTAIERYMASPESRIEVLQAQVKQLETEVRSLRFHLGKRSNWKKTIEERLSEIAAIIPGKS